jgi:hypothetical protein
MSPYLWLVSQAVNAGKRLALIGRSALSLQIDFKLVDSRALGRVAVEMYTEQKTVCILV